MIREIIAYGGQYQEFMSGLSVAERNKILRALLLFTDNERIPAHYIKHLEDGIYEFRVTYISNEFRIMFTYDGDKLVVLFNAFRKKTQKTPRKEIQKAKILRENYFKEKEAE